MLIAWLVVVLALAGLVLFLIAANPKAARIGEILFFCGTLVTCFQLAGRTFRLG